MEGSDQSITIGSFATLKSNGDAFLGWVQQWGCAFRMRMLGFMR